ncbi:MAG: molecular chaperone TorD family protein [Alphaproteobacteria bacterium]|nr:molecular chaperone TorD family protein [Alphaproteobacteria bacterium]
MSPLDADPLQDPRALALARGRALDLIGALFREGPTRVDALRAVEALAPFVPGDPEVAAAEHHRALSMEVFPFASVFLGARATLGGAHADAAREAMAQAGFDPAPLGVEPDHLGALLAALAFLCGAEADAWRDGRPDIAKRVRAHAAALIDGQLLPWLPALIIALEDARAPLYATAAGLALELIAGMREGPLPDWSLPQAPAVLDDPKAGLRRVGAHLAVPAFAGGMWTLSALTAVGRQAELAQGFGRRAQRIEGLLSAAAHYARVPALIAEMDHVMMRWSSRFRTMAPLAPTGPWLHRVEDARALLTRLVQAADAGATDHLSIS